MKGIRKIIFLLERQKMKGVWKNIPEFGVS
jgi:hypothetical protein